MPSNKTPTKKSTKKSSRPSPAQSRSSAKAKNADKNKGGDPTTLLHQLMPYILCLVAVFILVSYFISDSTGFLGGFLRNMMFGLFSGAAWCVPFLLVNIAFFWKRDVAAGSTRYKITFSVICTALLSVLIHAFSRNGGAEGASTFNVIELFKLGCEVKGGGIIGGIVGNILFAALGFAGTLIFSIALILLFGIFLFGMTPHMFAVYIITGIREWRMGFSDRMSDAKAEREQMLAEYEAERAAQAARREEQRAAAERERAKKQVKSRRQVNEIIDIEDDDDDDEIFDAAKAVESDAKANVPIDPSIFETVNAPTADKPPFDIDDGGRERISPLPLTGVQELEALENDEIDLSKIFIEPSGEAAASVSDTSFGDGEEIVTSAEIDLMVEKSRLALEPIMTEVYGEDDSADDTYMSVSRGRAKDVPRR